MLKIDFNFISYAWCEAKEKNNRGSGYINKGNEASHFRATQLF